MWCYRDSSLSIHLERLFEMFKTFIVGILRQVSPVARAGFSVIDKRAKSPEMDIKWMILYRINVNLFTGDDSCNREVREGSEKRQNM